MKPHALLLKYLTACGLVLIMLSGQLVSSTRQVNQPPALTLQVKPSSGHWALYRLTDGDNAFNVYVAHDSRPKPVVIFIHGSGCNPLITVEADGSLNDTSLFQDLVRPRLERFHFALVEKRGVEPLRFSPGMTRKQKVDAFEQAGRKCSGEYVQNVTKPSRVNDVVELVRALGSVPWAREIMLLGHSEGTHVATGVVRRLNASEITAVGLLASAGPLPFYSGYVAQSAGNTDSLREIVQRVRMLQQADDDLMYRGLPVRRWKTFWLDSTPIEDVRDSLTPIFVSQGSRDDTTLSADLFALEAIRQQPKRALRYVVVEQADHSFEMPDGRSRLAELFDDFAHWSLDPSRQTSIALLK
jgi:pimeloyl-ACP methyl ester carboxylesterase